MNTKILLFFFVLLLQSISCRTTRSTRQFSTFRFVYETTSDIQIQGWYLKKLQQDFRVGKNSFIDIEEEQTNTTMIPGEFFNSDSLELTFENNE